MGNQQDPMKVNVDNSQIKKIGIDFGEVGIKTLGVVCFITSFFTLFQVLFIGSLIKDGVTGSWRDAGETGWATLMFLFMLVSSGLIVVPLNIIYFRKLKTKQQADRRGSVMKYIALANVIMPFISFALVFLINKFMFK